MRTITTRPLRTVSVLSAVALSSWAGAEVVVTQVERRAFFSLWLLSMHPQQNVAHQQVIDDHEIDVVEVFTAETIGDADIVYVSPSLNELQLTTAEIDALGDHVVVYVSPSLNELQLTTAEIDALEQFVLDGGRLVIPADNGKWAVEFQALAARFDVSYGDTFINGIIQASVDLPFNPIVNGPGGVVKTFTGASINNNLNSTNPDFQVVATWEAGPVSVGYLAHGEGEVVFLSDFNTWDNDMISDLDNRVLWTNLFELRPGCTGDVNEDGTVDVDDLVAVILDWGCTDPPGPCAADVNADGTVNVDDLIDVTLNWGACGS